MRSMKVRINPNGVGGHRAAPPNVASIRRKRAKLEKDSDDTQILVKRTRLLAKEYFAANKGTLDKFLLELQVVLELASSRAARELYNASQKEVVAGEAVSVGATSVVASCAATETVRTTRSSIRARKQREDAASATAIPTLEAAPISQTQGADTQELYRIIQRLESIHGRGHPQILIELRAKCNWSLDKAASFYTAVRTQIDASRARHRRAPQPSLTTSAAATTPVVAVSEASPQDETDSKAIPTSPAPWVVWDRTHEYHVDLSKDQYDMDFRNMLFTREQQQRPCDYGGLSRIQPDIKYSMRAILIDWLVEVAEEYALKSQTLYLATHYIDYFLSRFQVSRSQLQLVGITCMLCATKYEEIDPPSIDDFVHISDMTYSPPQVRNMEVIFLNTVRFSLTHVTPVQFAELFFVMGRLDKHEQHMARFLMECMLITAEYLRFLPSQIAAAACYLAMRRFRPTADVWTPALAQGTRYSLQDIKACIFVMDTVVCAALKDQNSTAVIKKYRSRRQFQGVASLYTSHIVA